MAVGDLVEGDNPVEDTPLSILQARMSSSSSSM
jgi:hypothetical protein